MTEQSGEPRHWELKDDGAFGPGLGHHERVKVPIEWRYLNDAEFHMRVDLVVQSVELDLGIRLDEHDRSLATFAACCAIDAEDER